MSDYLSIAKNWFTRLKNLNNEIEFTRFDKREDGTDRVKSYIIHQYDLLLNKGKVSQVYFGQAAEKPFGTLSNDFKRELGQKILNR